MADDRVLAEFPLEDGTAVRVAVPRPLDRSAVEEVSLLEDTLYKSQQSLQSALAQTAAIATSVMASLKAAAADEVEVKFGVDLSVESGVIISSVGGTVNFEVTLKWTGKGTE